MTRAQEYDMNEKSSKETKKHGSFGGEGGVGYHDYIYICVCVSIYSGTPKH